MNNGVWNGYNIQNALVIIRAGRPKVLCAFFVTEPRWIWNYRLKVWEERRTEAHISVCSKVPPQVGRLWTPGARADDDKWGQGVEGSTNTGAASSGGYPWNQWGQGVEGSNNTGAASSGGATQPNTGGAADTGGAGADPNGPVWL